MRSSLSSLLASFTMILGSAAANAAPCDILEQAGNPCVAAHSVVRGLYETFDGSLYRVLRASDNVTQDIGVVSTGGVANAALQDAFCEDSDCMIDLIYDQSPMANHLTLGPAGSGIPEPDTGVNASKQPVLLGGSKVYAAVFEGGMGYRNDNTTGIAVDDEPETMYWVIGGKHYNNECCFDYGNAETDNIDHGPGTMEAVYWGNCSRWGSGAGDGPWIMADLESGIWAGQDSYSPANKPMDADFVTAMLKGQAGGFALKGGDAQRGSLTTLYEGGRPEGYEIMSKQGAIILGIGGDNGNLAVGTFYEGVMAFGYTSDSTDDAIQESISLAGYGV